MIESNISKICYTNTMLLPEKELFIEGKANLIRQSIIEMLVEAKSGHTAGPLGMADVFATLYFDVLKHKPENPTWEGRDRVILSNGHICPVLYATMAHSGYFEVSELLTLRKFGSRLQGHPHREWLPSLENSSGPLGSGLSQAIGMALADRIDNGRGSSKQFYCFMGDGELNEGQVWEALMQAGKEKIQNLTVIIDRNNIQIDGFTEDIMPLEPLADKFVAFGWHVIEVDGHSVSDIQRGFKTAAAVFEKPSIVLAHTIPGKGVEEFQKNYKWHGTAPSVAQGSAALRELRSLGGLLNID
jgi:transketolase